LVGVIIIGAAVVWGMIRSSDETHIEGNVVSETSNAFDTDPVPEPRITYKVPVDGDGDYPAVEVKHVLPADQTYAKVQDWHGTGSVQTETFHIESEKWAIEWSADSPPEQVAGVFEIEVSDGNESVTRIVANSKRPRTGDTTYLSNGPGTFSLNIRSNAEWKVEINQLVYTDQHVVIDEDELEKEAKLQNVREKIADDKARIAAEQAADPEAFAEKKATEKLRLAKTLLSKNEPAAKERLQEIIDEYPNTKAADEAQELLNKL
jgi:hypothetical protein